MRLDVFWIYINTNSAHMLLFFHTY